MSTSFEQAVLPPKKKEVVETQTNKKGLVISVESPAPAQAQKQEAVAKTESNQEQVRKKLQEAKTLLALGEFLQDRTAHKKDISHLVAENAIATGIPEAMAHNLHDRWAVLGTLGSGEQGQVYESVDVNLSSPGRVKKAALKRLAPNIKQLGTEPEEQAAKLGQFRERFIREAQAMAKINSPHVIRIYDADWPEDGDAWYVMDLAKGKDLQKVMKERAKNQEAYTVPEVLDAAEQLATGLADIHEAGIVHRDIKPANIYFDGKTYQYADFGLAKDAEKQRARLQVIENLALDLLVNKAAASGRIEQSLGRRASDRLRKILAEDLPADPGVKEALSKHDEEVLAGKYKRFYNSLRALASDVPTEQVFKGFETLQQEHKQERLGYLAEQVKRVQQGQDVEPLQGKKLAPETIKRIKSLAENLRDNPAFLDRMLAGEEPDLEDIALAVDMEETMGDIPLAEEGKESITKIGQRMGTPKYMSPEQTKGEITTFKSDVYALGTMLYEMATGKSPISGKTPMEFLTNIPKDEVEDAKKINQELPEAFSNLLQRMLAKNPADRPDAQTVRQELEKIRASVGA